MTVRDYSRFYSLICLILIISTGFILRYLVIFMYEFPPGGDYTNYLVYAGQIVNTGDIPHFHPYHQLGVPFTMRPVVPVYLSLLSMFSGVDLIFLMPTIIIFSVLSILSVYLFSKKLTNEKYALIAAFFVAVAPLNLNQLAWGSFANIVSLFILSLLFYYFLDNKKNSIVISAFLPASRIQVRFKHDAFAFSPLSWNNA